MQHLNLTGEEIELRNAADAVESGRMGNQVRHSRSRRRRAAFTTAEPAPR
jgi:hypothetical protein